MPTTSHTRRSGQETRQRILQCAILRFARNSYDATSLRDIAADVGVDVALVHRAFGSKEELFAAALEAGFDEGFLDAVASPDPAAALARQAFSRRLEAESMAVDPLDVGVRSLNSAGAKPILREFLQRKFLRPLAERIGGNGEAQAAMVMAVMAGFIILRDVTAIEALKGDDSEAIRHLLEGVLRQALDTALCSEVPPTS